MNTAIWGPPLWRILHGLSATFTPRTEKDVELMDVFIRNLQAVLPCVFCRDSLLHFLSDNIRDVKESARKGELDEWMYDLHNLVNDKLNKQQAERLGIPKELHDALLASSRVTLDVLSLIHI